MWSVEKEKKLFKKFEKEIAVLIAVQKEGRPTLEEIKQKLNEWKIKLAPREISEYCENLRRRDLLSIILEKEDRKSITRYALNKIKNIPNVAHYKDIVDYEEGKELIRYFDTTKGVNKGKTPDIKDYWKAKIVFSVRPGMTVRGFIPNGKSGDDKIDGCHYRDSKDNIILKPLHFKNYIGANLRQANKPESQKQYLGFTVGDIKLNGNPIGKESTYILAQRSGSGEKIWETLPEGCEIATTVVVPQTLFNPEEFQKFLTIMTENGIVGFGGWGKGNVNNLMVKEFKMIGKVW